MKNKLIFFIAILLVLSLFSIGIISSAETAGTTTASATAPAGTGETTLSISVPADAKEPGKVGDKIINENGKPGKPEDVTIKGGTITPNKDGGGKFVTGGLDANKADLGNKGELTSKGNEIKNMQKDSKLELGKKGEVEKAEFKAGKGGSEVKIAGKTGDLEFSVPEDAKVLKNKETKTYQVEIAKEHAKIEKEPVKKPKKESEEEGEDATIQYRSRDFFTQLPDDVAKQMGFSGKAVEFRGVLSNNGNNWFVGNGNEIQLKIDGKESLLIKNIQGKLINLNENINIYFKDEKFEGNYVSLANGKFKTGSLNNLDGHPVQFLEGNLYINTPKDSHLAVQALKNSEIGIENGKLYMKGGGIMDQDYTSYLLSAKSQQLFWKKGIGITGFNAEEFKDKTTTSLEFLPYKTDGSPVSPYKQKILIDNNKGIKVIGMNEDEMVGRIRGNLPAVDSRGGNVIPAVPNKISPPVQFIQPKGSAQQNAMASTVRISARDPDRTLSVGTGTIIGIKGNRAYVITAGHLFRINQGKSIPSIDLFDANAKKVKTVQGQVINYHADISSDIALLSIPVTEGMGTAKVAGKNYLPRIGEQVFSMGCNLGNDPTCMSGGISTINRYLGENNFEVSGRPEQGRSGGGLFNSEGKLIGVLSADTHENTGLYGGINFIHKYLDSLGLSDLYKLILAMFIKTQ